MHPFASPLPAERHFVCPPVGQERHPLLIRLTRSTDSMEEKQRLPTARGKSGEIPGSLPGRTGITKGPPSPHPRSPATEGG